MKNLPFYEVNMDGLVGPTHHYAGLAIGNMASIKNAGINANPQAAALQGLRKMRFLHNLGIKQALLPPQQRPNLALLWKLGFTGMPQQQIAAAFKETPILLSACYSSSSMWAANAATVTASADSLNNKVHFTAANLISNLHREQEAHFSSTILKKIFNNETYFQHHPILPKSVNTGDEGAANHSRLCKSHAAKGINLFVYGKGGLQARPLKKYPARQSFEASQAIARAHQLNEADVLFACQNPKAIELGVFHNDVIAVANESVFLLHEEAYLKQKALYKTLQSKADFKITFIEIPKTRLSIEKAVSSYLFNSQLITKPDGSMVLLAPTECEDDNSVKTIIDDILKDPNNPISEVHYMNLKQSMLNGGGPACLRLRLPLTETELKAMHQGILVDNALLDALEAWVLKYYRTQLQFNDLADVSLIEESYASLDALTSLLKLGALYPFQQ